MKPTIQWTTRRHRAKRTGEKPVRGLEGDGRAEAFELLRDDGSQQWARLGLERQEISPGAASDPDIVDAVKCWLAARGVRQLNLFIGRDATAFPLATGPFTLAELSDGVSRAQRLISLCPSNAELLDALGCFDRVIACEDSSDFPPRVDELERLGPDLDPNLERIVALAPDLVLSSLSVPGMERIVTGLRARGVKQVVLAPRSIADVLEEVRRVAATLGVAPRGERVVAGMREEIEELELALPAQRRRVYLEWWPKPMFTPGSACYSNELIQLAGGRNVFGDRPGSSVEISPAELVQADPEVCFVSWCGVRLDKLDPENLTSRPGLEELAAARRGHVVPLDERYSGRPGPRMLEAARVMARAIAALNRRRDR